MGLLGLSDVLNYVHDVGETHIILKILPVG